MLWILVFACGGAGSEPGSSPGDGSSIFEQNASPAFPAQAAPNSAGQTSASQEANGPGIPDQPPAREGIVAEPAPQADVPVSQACVDARERLARAEERVVRLRNMRITPAAERVDLATEVMAGCVRDVIGCGTRAAAYKKELVSAEAFYEKELDSVAAEEAKLFPLNQAVATACHH